MGRSFQCQTHACYEGEGFSNSLVAGRRIMNRPKCRKTECMPDLARGGAKFGDAG